MDNLRRIIHLSRDFPVDGAVQEDAPGSLADACTTTSGSIIRSSAPRTVVAPSSFSGFTAHRGDETRRQLEQQQQQQQPEQPTVHDRLRPAPPRSMSGTTGKRKEIYKYLAPWPLYSMNWSVRPDKRFRLALGSFVEEYNNKVQIISLDEDTSEFSAKRYTHTHTRTPNAVGRVFFLFLVLFCSAV